VSGVQKRYKHVKDIVKIMGNKERIRNVGILAHVDHGKTTLSDRLLSGAGIISDKIAAQALVLDYLEIEQRRQMTVKSANCSLIHYVNNQPYIINLVDTPGHIDFTGHVTRALRLIDGAVCVVDAVEEVMVQTETVTRQALSERIRPVLFINKIDRLIKELRLSPQEIQEKIVRIIRKYNELIEAYAEPQFREKWKVSMATETVALGSALHGWGMTLNMAKEKGIKFSDIVKAYEEGRVDELKRELPVHEAILEMVVRNIPPPNVAQRYRLEKIWTGDLESEIGKYLLECDEKGPLVMAINNVVIDPHAGPVATGRVFSGTVREGDTVYLIGVKSEYRIQQVSIYMGATRVPVEAVSAGNIAALLGLDKARAGETVVSSNLKNFPPFEKIQYVTEPVVTIAIEPKRPQDLPKLVDILSKLTVQDPNLVYTVNRETGETLLSGTGELHLEIALHTIREEGVEVEAGQPTVVYRESIEGKAGPILAKSPNKHNRLWISIEPLDEKTLELIEKGEIKEEMNPRQRAAILREKCGWNTDEAKGLWAIEEHKNVLIDLTTGVQRLNEIKQLVIAGFYEACKSGPLAGEPMRGIKAKLMNAVVHEDPAHRGPAQIMPATRRAIFGAFLSAKPVILEPIYKIEITVPPDAVGSVVALLNQRRGRIEEIEQRGRIVRVAGYIPVAETIGFSSVIRSATGGRAFWQTQFSHWQPLPKSLAEKVIASIRAKKGLPPEVPPAEEFIDTL